MLRLVVFVCAWSLLVHGPWFVELSVCFGKAAAGFCAEIEVSTERRGWSGSWEF